MKWILVLVMLAATFPPGADAHQCYNVDCDVDDCDDDEDHHHWKITPNLLTGELTEECASSSDPDNPVGEPCVVAFYEVPRIVCIELDKVSYLILEGGLGSMVDEVDACSWESTQMSLHIGPGC